MLLFGLDRHRILKFDGGVSVMSSDRGRNIESQNIVRYAVLINRHN